MRNPRIQRRTEWDGTFSLLLDGQVIRERRPLEVIEEAERYVDTLLSLRRAEDALSRQRFPDTTGQ